MRDPLKRRWAGKVVPIALGLLSCLVVIGFYPRFFEEWVIDPPMKGVGAILSGVSGLFHGSAGFLGRYVALVGIQKENVRLRQEVDRLNRSLDRFHAMEIQNRTLRDLLALRERASQREIACHVIADNPTAAPRTILLDCGSNQGVRIKDGVVGSRGVVGYVVRVFREFSQVLWIEDPMFALEGRLSEFGQDGLVRGRGAGHSLDLRYVAALVPVEKGSRVVTTGEDGFFPPNELIGRVVRSENGGHHIFRSIYLESAERLDSLWAVLVFVPSKNWTQKPLLGRKAS